MMVGYCWNWFWVVDVICCVGGGNVSGFVGWCDDCVYFCCGWWMGNGVGDWCCVFDCGVFGLYWKIIVLEIDMRMIEW